MSKNTHAKNQSDDMNYSVHEFYKSIGFELMAELDDDYNHDACLALGGGRGAYQTLTTLFSVFRFTAWRDGSIPYCIVFFDKSDHCIFELDLSMIVYANDLFSWHLTEPTDAISKQFMSGWLGEVSEFSAGYCDDVKKIRQALSSTVDTPRNGYRFVDQLDWAGLCDRFLSLMRKAYYYHPTDGDAESRLNEAANAIKCKQNEIQLRQERAIFRFNRIRLHGGRCSIPGEIEYQQIPLSELQIGRWYIGRGRNANIGLWNGECFLVIGLCGKPVSWKPRKWGNEPCIKQEPYFTAEDGCFQPFLLIDEGVASEPIEERYAKTLTFASEVTISKD